MTVPRGRKALVFAALVLVAGGLGVALRTSRHEPGGAFPVWRVLQPAPPSRSELPRPIRERPAVLLPPEAPLTSVDAPGGPPRGEQDGVAEGAGPVEAFVQRLEEIEARAPLAFHARAAEDLLTTRTDLSTGRESHAVEALAILDDDERLLSPRVRGVVLGLLGAWGRQPDVLALTVDEETWRSGVLGLSATVSEAGAGQGIVLDPTEFFSKQPRGGVHALPLELARVPDAVLHEELVRRAVIPAESLEDLVSRDVAILALGTGVDQRPRTLDLLAELLLDTSPPSLQVRGSVCFVLAHARSDAARELLLAFLEDPQLGDHGKLMARWWMSDRPAVPGELAALAAPLLDPGSSKLDRMGATGSLLKRIDVATPQELVQMEEILARRVLEETDRTAHLAAVSTLALMSGGLTKLTALDDVLRADDHATCRRWAARGLGSLEAPHRAAAEGLLRAALAREPNDVVRGEIRVALLE